jgi:hypothetical protein
LPASSELQTEYDSFQATIVCCTPKSCCFIVDAKFLVTDLLDEETQREIMQFITSGKFTTETAYVCNMNKIYYVEKGETPIVTLVVGDQVVCMLVIKQVKDAKKRESIVF